MFSDKISAKFQRLCDTLDTDTDARQIDQFRQIILFRSNGLCPAKHIVSSENGTFLSSKQLCDKSTYESCVKRKSIFEFKRLEGFLANARAQEVKMQSSQTSRCAITKPQEQHLSQLAETYKDDCQGFRTSLLTEPAPVNVVAIHVCRWDGTPRKSVSEIQRAICLYPSSPQQMSIFLKVFLGGVVAIAVAGTVAGTMLAIDQLVKSNPLGQTVRLQCGNKTVTLFGETHGKKIRGQFLPKFVDQMMKEGATKSIIFVEAREWENVDYDEDIKQKYAPWTTTAEKANMFFNNQLIHTSPVTFFSYYLSTNQTLLPQQIKPYDHRYTAINQYIVEVKGLTLNRFLSEEELLSKDVKLPLIHNEKLFHNLLANQISFLAEFPDLAQKFENGVARIKTTLYSPTLTQTEANTMVNDLYALFMSIPDTTLAEYLHSYGEENNYVFMGDSHVKASECILKERFKCVALPL